MFCHSAAIGLQEVELRKRTEVLDEHLASVKYSGDVSDEGLAVLKRLPGGRVEETNAVEVANTGLLGNGLLHILDGRAGGQLDAGGETLDRLLRCCSGGKRATMLALEDAWKAV